MINVEFKNLSIGLVGLAISYALSVTSLLSGVINAFTETEREMIAVERVGEYINQVDSEETKTDNDINLPYGWPNWGMISFDNVVMKYRYNFQYIEQSDFGRKAFLNDYNT
jgi:ATP-binding cassette, subfamily C (CFTR/MRP), member 10